MVKNLICIKILCRLSLVVQLIQCSVLRQFQRGFLTVCFVVLLNIEEKG